jgi:RNA polymerase sigma-70 factor (ECF subfamily)
MGEQAKSFVDTMSEAAATKQLSLGFDEAFTLHHRTVFRAARAVVRDAGLAEDITQETFLRLYRHMNTIQNDEMLRPWLIRVAMNLAKNALRGNYRATQREETYVKDAGTGFGMTGPEVEFERREEAKSVHIALDQIREPLRSCLLLKQQGLSYREIADALEVNETSVGTFVARARKEFVLAYNRIGRDA